MGSNEISMAYHTAVTPLLTHGSYHSYALSQRPLLCLPIVYPLDETQSNVTGLSIITNSKFSEYHCGLYDEITITILQQYQDTYRR